MDLSTFIKESVGTHIYEAVRSRDIEKAIQLISSYLKKRKIYTVPVIHQCTVESKRKLTVMVWTDNNEGGAFIWDLGASAQIEAVAFTKDFDKAFSSFHSGEKATTTWDVYVEAKGANTLQMCKLVELVLTGKCPMSVSKINDTIRDAQIFESAYEIIEDGVNEDIVDDLRKKKNQIYHKMHNAKKKGQNVDDLQAQFDEISKQLQNARLSVKGNAPITVTPDQDIEAIQSFFEEEERATPEERFEDMVSYIHQIIAGIRPFALLCGAPGVGKTFRVKQTIKQSGLDMSQDALTGDWLLLKGKCTATNLYKSLFNFKAAGQIVVFDDCDSVFKDPDAINLLKAAYDSDDERYVSWGTAQAIPYPDQEAAAGVEGLDFDSIKGKWMYPKQFLYEGSGILITNFSAGQIDTAIRNRALICDLDFTVQEVLDLISGLAPKIMPGVLSDAAKEKALEYLQELADKKAPVNLSIRSFTLCAQMYMSDAPEKAIQRRIRENMRLQSLRGGSKY